MPFVILNVDGQSASLQNRSLTLRSQGYLVREAETGDAAFKVACGECLTAAIMAPRLKDMSGFDLARRFKADPRTNRVPLLHVARESSAEADRQESAASGAEACLVAPVDTAVLRATLDWLSGGRAKAAPPYLAARWQTVVETLTGLLVILQPGGWSEYVSPRWIRHTGAPAWRHIGFGWLEGVHPEDRERSALLSTVSGSEASVTEMRLRRHDGVYGRFRASFTPLRDETGAIARWLGFFEDVEYDRTVRDELRRRESELSTALDNLPVGVWFTDSEGRIIFGNPAAQRIWAGARYVGIPSYAEYKGWWADTGKRIEAEEWALARALQKGETSLDEMIEIECFDGGRKTILNSAVPVLGDGARIIGALVINEDITARRRQEEALRISRERLDMVLDTVGVGLWYCDLPFDKLVWNEQCKEHFGLPPDADVTIGTFFERLHPDDRERTTAAMNDSIDNRAPFDTVYRTVGLDGRLRWIRSIGRVFYSANGTPARFDGVTVDVTAQKRAEEALRTGEGNLRRMNEQLRRANDDLSQFSHAASHDLQEPLRLISIYSQWLERDCQGILDAGTAEKIQVIRNAAERMRRLLGDVLAYTDAAMIEGACDTPADCSQLAARTIARFRPEIDFTGATVVCDPLPPALVRPADFEAIVERLVENALEYRGEASPEVRISACPSGRFTTFAVSDNGVGIPPGQAERIFGIFKCLHGQDVPGTGAGLAICQKIVERYGGRMWVDSTPGQGSTFYFTLPTAL